MAIIEIKQDNPTNPAIIELLQQHHQQMLQHSPKDSVHALDVDSMDKPNITFYSAWFGDKLAGCIALKQLDKHHGELKSMRTATTFVRQGVAKQLLSHLMGQAKQLGLTKLSLETGTAMAFQPAIALYQDAGFIPCQPFADYRYDPYSCFMSISL